jgi:ADP-ribosylglycohydrolase
MTPTDASERVAAALRALAVGDAMGRATEHYEPAEIADIYEDAVTEFVEPVRLFDDEEWAAAETGLPTAAVIALAPPARGDEPGVADPIGRLPTGVALGLRRPLRDLLARPPEPPIAAMAAAVSAAVDGHPAREVLGLAAEGARAAGDAELAERIMQAGGIAQASGGRRAGAALRETFSPSGDARSVVPFILGVVYATQSARRAILEAVNQGGHAPETAAIAGAICGAIVPISLPPAWAAEVERVNNLDLAALAARYTAARAAGSGPDTSL